MAGRSSADRRAESRRSIFDMVAVELPGVELARIRAIASFGD